MREILDLLSGHYGSPGTLAKDGPVGGADTAFRRDVLAGLRLPRRELPCRHLFDGRSVDQLAALNAPAEGSSAMLEVSLLKACSRALAELIGEGASVVELGGCSVQKARILLGALKNPLVYMPVELSTQHLWSTAMQLQVDYPYLAVRPVNADFTTLTRLPEDGPWVHDCATFALFGPIFGMFDPVTAVGVLRRLGGLTQRNFMIVGVDLPPSDPALDDAYGEGTGLAAKVNLSLLRRINRELDGDFDPAAFDHVASYNPVVGRLELHLRSRRRQMAHAGGEEFPFAKGETIHTQSAYKYKVRQFHRMAERAGYLPVKAWTDLERTFSLHVLCKAGGVAS